MGLLFLYPRPQRPDYELSAAALPRFARAPDPWLSRSFRDAAEPRAGLRSVDVGEPHRTDRPLHCPRRRLPQSVRHVGLVWGSAAMARCALHQHGRGFSSVEDVSRESEFGTKPVVWSKTVHELPDDFANAVR